MSKDLNAKDKEFWNKWSNLVRALDDVVLPLEAQYKELVQYLHENREDIGVSSPILPYMKEMDTLFLDIFRLHSDKKLGDTEPDFHVDVDSLPTLDTKDV